MDGREGKGGQDVSPPNLKTKLCPWIYQECAKKEGKIRFKGTVLETKGPRSGPKKT
jgi:hypothetical protein